MADSNNRGYWTEAGGRNLLKGVPGDVDNPPRLTDEMILFAIQHSQVARVEWDRVLPGLLQAEQDRLNTILADNPWRSRLLISNQSAADRQQALAIARNPVRTVGPRGGIGASHISVRR